MVNKMTSSKTNKRTYHETHPWITFQLDLRNADFELWLLLGEAQARCKYLSGVPLLPEVAREFNRVYLAKGVLATTAIEGNTLTEEEVLKRMEGELKLPPSKEYLGKEIDNIIEGCNIIAKRIFTGNSSEYCLEQLKEFNKLVLRDLPLIEDVIPGELRKHSVLVGRYRGAPSEDLEFLINKLCDWLNNEFSPLPGYEIAFGILRAIIVHLYIAWIHPFADGNGRTARLLELQTMLSVGVPQNAAHLLSNHYNQTRLDYYRQLDLTSKSGGDVIPFIKYALKGFIDGLQEHLDRIKGQQLKVHWINFIHDQFKDRDSVADTRRRHLILDLTDIFEPTPISKIRYISARMAEEYASKTEKTIRRDITELENLNLIEKTPKGIMANRKLINAFMPRSLQ
jgi:Fic family protein